MRHEQKFIEEKTNGLPISTTIRDMLLNSNEFREYVVKQEEQPHDDQQRPAYMVGNVPLGTLTGSFSEEQKILEELRRKYSLEWLKFDFILNSNNFKL